MGDSREAHEIGGLLSLLAHDLRGPLSALQSTLGYVLDVLGDDPRDAREAITDGLVSCDGLAHLISNIDTLAEHLRERAAREEAFGVAGFVQQVVAGCSQSAVSHRVELEVDAGVDAFPNWAGVNRRLANNCLGNLIRSAVQHSPPRGTVKVRCESHGEDSWVVVEDGGPALSQEDMLIAFSLPGQLDADARTGCRYSRGWGLYCAGLASGMIGARISLAQCRAGGSHAVALGLPIKAEEC